MAHISNARNIADIEFVIEAPSLGREKSTWLAHGAECSRDRHRFSGQDYSFSFEVVHLRHNTPSRSQWHVVIISELWRFEGMRGEPRTTKSLRVLRGKSADVLAWMRQNRDQKLRGATS